MRLSLLLALIFPLALSASAVAQDYWEYAPTEDEWEYHQPTRGLETEYEWDDEDYYNDYTYEGGDVEVEQYEWEAGEGYHEQEWYDPSDWLEFGSDIDYEDNWFTDDDYEDNYNTYDNYDNWGDDSLFYDDYYTDEGWYESEYGEYGL